MVKKALHFAFKQIDRCVNVCFCIHLCIAYVYMYVCMYVFLIDRCVFMSESEYGQKSLAFRVQAD
jgi:hypothetical protein